MNKYSEQRRQEELASWQRQQEELARWRQEKEEITRRQLLRYAERNRIKDARRGQMLMQTHIDNLVWRGLLSIFISPEVQGKSPMVALILGLLFGPFALPFYLHSFGTFVRWFFFAGVGALLATAFLPAGEHALAFLALIIGWSVPAIIAAGHIKIRKAQGRIKGLRGQLPDPRRVAV